MSPFHSTSYTILLSRPDLFEEFLINLELNYITHEVCLTNQNKKEVMLCILSLGASASSHEFRSGMRNQTGR